MKLIKKLVNWFEDLLWTQAIKDVFCPYVETKDKDDECEAWRTIQKIRQEE